MFFNHSDIHIHYPILVAKILNNEEFPRSLCYKTVLLDKERNKERRRRGEREGGRERKGREREVGRKKEGRKDRRTDGQADTDYIDIGIEISIIN